jgi:succinate dehydrogenase / fumarate reductase, cytochrome b subunit
MRERPLSPHLQVYRWPLSMTMSILHRASGIAWWRARTGSWCGGCWRSPPAARPTRRFHVDCIGSPLGELRLSASPLAMMYHLLNGIRHLMWDIGWGSRSRPA